METDYQYIFSRGNVTDHVAFSLGVMLLKSPTHKKTTCINYWMLDVTETANTKKLPSCNVAEITNT